MSVVRGRPPGLAGGIIGTSRAYCSSLRACPAPKSPTKARLSAVHMTCLQQGCPLLNADPASVCPSAHPSRIGFSNGLSGGANYKAVREQSLRLALCRLTFYRSGEGATLISNGSFVRDAFIPDHEDVWQPRLWRDTVKLDEQFYKSLIEHPLLLREAATREIAHRSMTIDIYVWLAYRLHALAEATPITWKALHAQFGAGFSQVKHFKPKFKEP